MPVIVKDLIWPKLRYFPHDGQQLIHHATERHRCASCGRRFGKSTVGGRELVPEALLTHSLLSYLEDIGKQRRFWITGPDYSDSEKEFRVLYNDLKRLQVPMDKPGTYYNAKQGDLIISCFGGRFMVEGKSAKYPDSLDGEGLSGALLVEAAKMKRSVFHKFIRPALADERGWSLSTSTPEGKNWFYELWQWGQDPLRPAWNSWRMPSWKNNILFPGGEFDPEIVDMREEMSPELFAQEVEADFTEFVGRVFKTFDEEIHVADLEYRPDWPLFGATDYGWANPFVWLAIQVDPFGNIYVIGEYRRTERDINDAAQDLYDWPLARNAIRFFPEPASPGDTAVLAKKLRMQAATNTGGELKHRIELIREKLKLVPESQKDEEKRHPKLLIDRRCTGLIYEMLNYRYPEKKTESVHADPEKPLDKDDHGPEALGRFMRGYFGGPAEEENGGRARVRKAAMTSARR